MTSQRGLDASEVGFSRPETIFTETLPAQERFGFRKFDRVGIEAEELRVRTRRSVHLNGETIRLNCDDDASAAPGQPAGHLRGPGCGGGHGAQ